MKIYTVTQIAEYLEVSPRTIRDLLRTKKIKGYKKLNKWFILHADLVNWLIK